MAKKKSKIKLTKDGRPKKSGGQRANAGRKRSGVLKHWFQVYVTDEKAKEWGNGSVRRGVRNIKVTVQKELEKLEKPF
jgi:hypothetical protein